MYSASVTFQRDVGAQVATLLGKNYRFFKSRLELRAPSDDGENVLVLSAASKFSPYISLAFYFGRHYFGTPRMLMALFRL